MRILIVRLGSMGDIVHAIPAAAALRQAFPQARIDWLVDARHRSLLELVPSVDRRMAIGGDGGWTAALGVVRDLRRGRYDVALDLQGLLKSAVLARCSGARRVIGFSTDGLRERAARVFYTEVQSPPNAAHVIDKNLSLLVPLGVRSAARRFPLDGPPTDIVSKARALLGVDPSARFAVINPGGTWPNKRWPPDRFGALARALRDRHGVPSLVLWGPGEALLAREIAAASSGAAAAAPATSLADLVALARSAAVVVSGDTGPLHLAAAVGAPIVGLYGPTDPARNGPWSVADITLSRYSRCECRYARRCRTSMPCILEISTEQAVDAVERRLAGAPAHG